MRIQGIKGVDLALERFFSKGSRIDRQKNRNALGNDLFEYYPIISHNWEQLSDDDIKRIV